MYENIENGAMKGGGNERDMNIYINELMLKCKKGMWLVETYTKW